MLFPVYAIIVGSFESTETLFSGTFYWLPHEATLDNYRTVLLGGSESTQATVAGSQSRNVQIGRASCRERVLDHV